ncbi:cell division protein SepF [Carnobacterium gallinarum]|uniref:cell division protein SepF n=1 Tax=Carnobacterium gallinarum TaxID=2749 RepID=UPI00054D2FFB|nr:cell division protein SepF [Carnobacterium gallinarum]
MSIFGSVSKYFGLDDEEEYDYEEEYEVASEEPAAKASVQPQVQAFNETKKATTLNRGSNQKNNKVVALNQGALQQQSKIVVFEPRVYSEVQEVADLLMNGQSVILNFNRIEEDQAKRIVDFLTGTIYAINGDIQRVGDEIFLCTPHNVEIDGMLTEMMRDKEFY